jgi:hypothetical protein
LRKDLELVLVEFNGGNVGVSIADVNEENLQRLVVGNVCFVNTIRKSA